MRFLLKVILALLALYLFLSASLLALMFQPPDTFAKVISQVPEPLLDILPLKPLWLFARSGNLKVSSSAPDFRLRTPDKKSWVQLSSFRGQKPVVLVFGSYT